MDYIFTFLEGIASFISPCMLPMIPIYVSYFVGDDGRNSKKKIINSVGFVLGFTIIFLLLSIFASKLGSLILSGIKYIKSIFGILIILLGVNYMGIFKIGILNRTKGINLNNTDFNFLRAVLFGILFSISWTPCIGSFLSSALLLVASNQDILKGIILMFLYSIGIGIPFIISAILIDKVKTMFSFIKKHYNFIKIISGVILIIMGFYTII